MKKPFPHLIIIWVLIEFLLLSRSAIASHQITYFRENKKGAICLTFDDGYPSQLIDSVSLMNARNIKGTFFPVASWIGSTISWQSLIDAAEQGHEIGSHSVTHPYLTTLSDLQLRWELSESQRLINMNIPSQSCLSFIYPYGDVNGTVEAVTSEYYIAARGTLAPEGGYLNYYEDGPFWRAVDFFNVGSYGYGSYEEIDIGALDPYLTLAEQRHGWLSLHFHEISSATSFAQLLDYLLTKDIWIDTFGSIVRYMRERLSSTVTVLSESSTEIKLDLTHTLDNSIYNEPLTIRSVIPPTWSKVQIQQGANIYIVNSTAEGVETAIYYDALPNNGTITLTLSEGGPTETVSPPSVLSGPSSGTTGIPCSYFADGSSSNFGHAIEYQFDWKGDGVTDLSPWGTATQSKTWSVAGSYNVSARARCVTHPGVVSLWTSPMAVSITQAVVNTLLELNFEEGSGNTALDTSGSGNNGSINGAVYTTASAVGSYALSFDGNDSVTVPANGFLKPTNISVAFWVKHTNDTTSPDYGGIMQGAYGNGYGAGFRILDYNNRPLAQLNFGDAQPIRLLGNPFVPGVWCHIALTYDHSKVRLYQNGVFVGEMPETRNINWSANVSNLTIGLAQWYFKGSIDKVKIYDYPISAQEITQLYSEGVGVPAQYTLTVNTGGSGSVTKNPDKAEYDSGDVVQLTAAPASGWVFSGWSGDLTGSTNPQSISMNANKSVTATFVLAPVQYMLMVDVTGSGSVTKNPDNALYNLGDVVLLTAVPAAGWTFTNWSGDLTGGANPASITMNSNKSVTATFFEAPVQHTLTVNVTGSGLVTRNPDKALYDSGESVELTAVPATGWLFSGWSGDLTGSTNPQSISVDANKTVTGIFVQTYTYVVTTSPSGLQFNVDGVTYTTPQTFNWVVDSTHTLTVLSPQKVAAGTQCVYNSWSDGGAQTHGIRAPSSNTTYTASFDTQYILTTSVTASGGTVSPSGTNWYNSGRVVSISAMAKTGYTFLGWSGDLSGTVNPSSITMTGPMSVRANFKKAPK